MNNKNNMSVSLFIPFAFVHHSADFIKDVIENRVRLGKVKQVDVITKMNSTKFHNKYNIAYVYFEKWNDDENTNEFLKKLKSKNKPTIRFEKDFGNPMYPTCWKVFENILIDKRRMTPVPLKSLDDFQYLCTNVNTPNNVTNQNISAPSKTSPPPAPRKAKLSSCVRNINKELTENAQDEHNFVGGMEMVYTGYLRQLKEDNQRLRELREHNERIIEWHESQKYMMQQEITRLNKMMHTMIVSGSLS